MLNLFLVSTLTKILIVVLVVVVFFIVTIINLKTKKPEDCENINEKCSTCNISCIYNKSKDKDNE